MLQCIGMTSNITQDSGIHTMSSKRDSAFNDGNCYTYSNDHNRRARSDYASSLPCHISGHSSRSVDHVTHQLQQLPMLQNNRNCMSADEHVPIYYNQGIRNDIYGKVFPDSVQQPAHSHCSQHCCQPTDPGGGLFASSINKECRAGSQCLQSQCCAVQTSRCSNSKILLESPSSNIQER